MVEMHQSERWSWIHILFWTSVSSQDTAGWPVELIEECKRENELFLSTQNRPFVFDVDRFQNSLSEIMLKRGLLLRIAQWLLSLSKIVFKNVS